MVAVIYTYELGLVNVYVEIYSEFTNRKDQGAMSTISSQDRCYRSIEEIIDYVEETQIDENAYRPSCYMKKVISYL